MSTRVVVELTADEDRLLNAFRRATAADEKMRAGLARTGATVGDSGRLIAEAMAKAATQTGASVDRMIGSLRQTGSVGRKLSGELVQFMSDFEIAGKKSVQTILEDLERVDSTVATQAHIILEQFEAADKAEKFADTTKQIEALGGKFSTLAQRIRQSTSEPLIGAEASAAGLIAELEKIDPSKAEAIRTAITAANAAAETMAFDKMVAELGNASAEAQSLVKLMGTELKRATLDSAGGVDKLKSEILRMYPDLRDAIAQWETTTQEADRKEKFTQTTKQIETLGGKYAEMAAQIRKSTAEPIGDADANAAALVAQLEQIDPSKAESIREAIEAANVASQNMAFDKMIAELGNASTQAQSLVRLMGTELKRSTLESSGGIETLKSEIVSMYPQLRASIEQWEIASKEADRADKFASTTKQIEALGGEYTALAAKIREATSAPVGNAATSAQALVSELEKIDPSKAQAIRDAITSANVAAENMKFDRMIAELGTASKEAQSLVNLMGTELKRSTLESAGGIDALKSEIVKMYPDLRDAITKWEVATQESDRSEKFTATTKQIETLGGKYAELAAQIRRSTAAPMDEAEASAAALVKELQQIDPSRAQAIADAMTLANVAAQNMAFDKMIAELGAGSKEAQSLVQLMGTELKRATLESAGGIDALKSEIVAMYPDLREAIAQWEVANQESDRREKFTETTKQLEALGGEYATLAKKIRDATFTPMGAADKHAASLVRELEKIDPAKAQAIQAAMAATRTQVEQTRVDELLRVLSSSSDEARELSGAIGDGISQAALQAQGGIEGIAAEIVALRPELSGFVEQWRTDVAEAARYGEGQFKKMLDELRAGDKVSRQVAESIKKEMVAAGVVGEKSFEDMLEPLRRLHPTLAAQAQKMKAEFDAIEAKGKGSFAGIAGRAVTELKIIAGAYIGVQEAIQAVTDTMQEQADLRRDAANEQRSVAQVEADARKNLAGFSGKDRDYLLGDFVKQVMTETTFSDRKALVDTIGAVASAGASDMDTIKRVVTEAAMLTAPTPEKLATMAPALVDVAKATGTSERGQSASFIMEIGRLARITDPEKVFRNVAPAMSAGFQAAEPGKGLEGALQGGAIFAALTRGAVDPMGDSSQTAAIQFIQRMDEFFGQLGEDSKSVKQARRELASLQTDPQLSEQQQLTMRELKDRQSKAGQTDEAIATTKAKIRNLQDLDGFKTSPAQHEEQRKRISEAKNELAALEAMRFGDAEQARLADLMSKLPGGREYEAKVADLQRKISEGTIPGAERFKDLSTPEQQMRALQSNKALQESFLSEEFGEQRFRPIFDQLVLGGRAFDDFQEAMKALRSANGNTRLFDEMSGEMLRGSPQLSEATSQRETEIGRTNQLTDDVTLSLARFRESLAVTLKETRSPSFMDAFGQRMTEPYEFFGGPAGSPGPEEVVSGIQRMMARRSDLRIAGVTNEEQPLIVRLESDIEAAMNRLASLNLQKFSPEKILDARQRTANALKIETQSSGVLPGTFNSGGFTPGIGGQSDEYRIDVLRRMMDTLDKQIPERTERRTHRVPPSGQPGSSKPDPNATSAMGPQRDDRSMSEVQNLLAQQVQIAREQLDVTKQVRSAQPLPSRMAVVQAAMANAGARA